MAKEHLSIQLPAPLTREEEQRLLPLLTARDESVVQLFIEKNLRLVAFIARRFVPHPFNDIDDAFSIGTVGLIKAVNTFDFSKKVKFATYATRVIQNEILMQCRKIRNYEDLMPINFEKNIAEDVDGGSLMLQDIVSDTEFAEEFDQVIFGDADIDDQYLTLAYVIYMHDKDIEKKLYTEIIKEICINPNMSMVDIGAIVGCSQSYISRIIRRIKEKVDSIISRTSEIPFYIQQKVPNDYNQIVKLAYELKALCRSDM